MRGFLWGDGGETASTDDSGGFSSRGPLAAAPDKMCVEVEAGG